ncbi:extracellular ribonuclease LE [Tanacetum coccineum]
MEEVSVVDVGGNCGGYRVSTLVAILLKNDNCDSSDPLPNAPLSSLPKPKASPNFQVRRRPPAPPPPPSKVKSYTLAVQWPPGVCSGKHPKYNTCKIPIVPTEFTIHGLWPEYSPTDPPATKTLNYNQLGVLTTDLKKSWPNLWSEQKLSGENLVFWNHEWVNHGRFSEMEGLDYFRKTLDLFKDVGEGLKGTLKAKGIEPVNAKSNKTTYTLVRIQTALHDITGGFSCTVRCVPSKLDNVPQIQEIRFSYKQNFDKKDNSASSNCGPNVRFPA